MVANAKGWKGGVLALLDRAPRFARRMFGRRTAAEANALADRAMAARRAGDWSTAATVWREAIAASPAKPTWRLRAVEAAARAGLAQEAESWARSVSDEDSVKAEAALAAAAALADIGRNDEAVAVLQLATGPDVNRAWLAALSARLRLAAGDIDGARRLADVARSIGDPSGKAMQVLKRCGLSTASKPAASRPRNGPFAAERAAAPAGPADIAQSLEAMATVRDAHAGDEILTPAEAPAGAAPRTRADPLASLHARVDIPKALRPARRGDGLDHGARLEKARDLMRPGLYDQSLKHWQVLHAHGVAGTEPLVQLARCLQQLGLHEAAVEAFGLVAEQTPLNVAGWLGKARSLQALGDPRVLDAWRDVLRLDPVLEEAGVMLARELSDRGDHAGAIAAIEGILAHNRVSDQLRIQKARLLRSVGEEEAAIALLRALCAEQPRTVRFHVELGRALRDVQDHEGAVEAWGRVAEIDPVHAEGARGLADAHEAMGRFDLAQDVWERRIAQGRGDWEAWVYLARLQRRQNLRGEAIQSYLHATESAPHEIRALSEAARYISNATAGLFEGLTLANRWVELVPESSDAYVCRAQIYATLRRLDESDADLEVALRIAPTSVPALMTKAKRLYAQLRWSDAEVVARAWREADNNSSDSTDLLARCLSNQGFNAQAEALYREQREANPGDIRAVLAVAEFCRRDRKLDDAVALWREALQIDPASPAAWTNLVSSLANADREAEALADFAAAQQNMGDGPDALLHYAIMLDRGRFIDMADAAYRKAVAVAPGTAAAPRNYGRYLAAEGRLSEALKALNLAREADPQSWELALELIDVIEGLALFGHRNPVAVLNGPDLGAMIPEKLFERVVEAAGDIEPYEPVPGRVLLFTQSLAAGGAERQLAASAAGLAARPGVDVHVSCLALDPNLGRDFYAGAIRSAGAPIWSATAEEIAEAWEDPVVQAHREILRRLPPDMGPVAWWLAQIRRLRPEVVHPWQDMTSLSVSLAAILAGAPRILLGTRSVRPDNPRRRLRRWMRHAYQQVLERPNVTLMANSAAGGADYADWLGIDPARVKVVYNGLAFEALRKDAGPRARSTVRSKLGVPADAPLIGGVFRMSEEKRPMLWMETAGLVAKARPDAHFVVCGAGPFYEEMAAYAVQEGFADRMHLPGVQSGIGKWFAAMDAVLLTSRHEGLPNVLIEAQSLGVPVVVPAVGGAPEVLLDGETGFAIPKATAADLAEKLLFILSDEAWRDHARAAAAAFIAGRFSMERMVDATLEVYYPEGLPAPKAAARPKAASKPRKGASPTPAARPKFPAKTPKTSAAKATTPGPKPAHGKKRS